MPSTRSVGRPNPNTCAFTVSTRTRPASITGRTTTCARPSGPIVNVRVPSAALDVTFGDEPAERLRLHGREDAAGRPGDVGGGTADRDGVLVGDVDVVGTGPHGHVLGIAERGVRALDLDVGHLLVDRLPQHRLGAETDVDLRSDLLAELVGQAVLDVVAGRRPRRRRGRRPEQQHDEPRRSRLRRFGPDVGGRYWRWRQSSLADCSARC